MPNKALQQTAATVIGLPGRKVTAVAAAAELGRSARSAIEVATMEHAEPMFTFPAPESLIDATQKAKSTLPRFRKALQETPREGVFYCAKLHFPMPNGDEGSHIWLRVNELFADLYFCSPIELPSNFVGMKLGETKLATDDDIEDWMIMDSGTLYGGFSLRAIRDQMPLGKRAEFDSYTGISRFAGEDAEPGAAADRGNG